MAHVDLPAGRIHYSERGTGRPVVCLHGYLMGEELFAPLAERLAALGLRVITPTWPLGAHRTPMRPGADVTPLGVAGTVADFCAALDLEDVVLLGNDTGGAITQLVATRHPERIGALVLTNCDAFDNFPPSFFRALVVAARVPGVLSVLLQAMRLRAVRRSRLGYGLLSHGDVDALAAQWVRPVLEQSGVRRDLRTLTRGLRPALTLRAAEDLRAFEPPVLLAWAADDPLFPLAHAHALADRLPDARVEVIAGSRAYSMIDQTEVLARLVAGFAVRV